MNCTIICFDYGGSYSREDDLIRWSSGGDRIHTLAIRTGAEEVTYSALVEGIGKKMKIDPVTTQLKLSFFPMILNVMLPSDVSNDDEVFNYLMQVNGDGRRNLLHVEVVEDVDQSQRSVQVIREVRETEVDVGEGMMTGYTDEPPEDYALVQQEYEDNFGMYELNEENFGMHEDNEGEDVVDRHGIVCPPTPWEDGVDIVLGQEFGSRDEVRVLVQIASHQNCFEYKIDKTCPRRYVLKCWAWKEGCKWYLRVLPKKDSDRWKVVTYEKMHTCSRADASTKIRRRRGSSKVVASILQGEYPGNFETPKPKNLIKMVKEKASVDILYTTAWRGKQLAANIVRGSPEESYRLLDCYMYMLRKTNMGTRTFVEWDGHGRFKYMFFALGACIKGFKAMRQVIIVDTTHLKHSYGGVLIVAMAQDPNHHHYPIAFGVADGENEASWMWFMKKLKLVVPDHGKLMFISDRNVSLIKSVSVMFPLSQHGYCIYHLSQNVKTKVSSSLKKTVAGDFMKCAETYTEHMFLTLYSAFRRKYQAAAVYLDKSVVVEKWARCYFPGEMYNIVTTNSVESVNGVFVDTRKYTLLPMIDMTVAKIAEWFNKHRKAANELPESQKLVPHVNDIIEHNIPIWKKLLSEEINSLSYEYIVIGRDGKNYAVNLSEKTCTCKYFDIDKYPCVHAIQAIIRLSGETEVRHYEFASHFYLVEQWVLAYNRTIYPVPHMSTWMIPNEKLQTIRFGKPPAHDITKGPAQQTRYLSTGEHQGRGRGRGRGRRGHMYDYLGGEPSTSNPI